MSLYWVDETLLDVVFERPTPVGVGEEESQQDGRPWLWGNWDDLPEPWRHILMLNVLIIGAGIFGVMVGLLVTTVLR